MPSSGARRMASRATSNSLTSCRGMVVRRAAPAQGGPPRGGLSRKDEVDARRELALDIARNIIRPNLEALIDLGAKWIQIDEPGASTEEDELDVFVESFNVSVEGLEGCMFSTHLCFPDYDLF